MDEAAAITAIEETLRRPKIGGVRLKLTTPAFEHVLIRSTVEGDGSLSLHAELVAGVDHRVRAELEPFGWRSSPGSTGRPGPLRRTWTHAQPETAPAVAAEARRALERSSSVGLGSGAPLVALDGGVMADPGFAQVGCLILMPSLLVGLAIAAILRLEAGQSISVWRYLLLAAIGSVAAFTMPQALVTIAVRVAALRPHLEKIAFGSLATSGGVVVLIADWLLDGA